jgi:hypothetical protein
MGTVSTHIRQNWQKRAQADRAATEREVSTPSRWGLVDCTVHESLSPGITCVNIRQFYCNPSEKKNTPSKRATAILASTRANLLNRNAFTRV